MRGLICPARWLWLRSGPDCKGEDISFGLGVRDGGGVSWRMFRRLREEQALLWQFQGCGAKC